jgi:hypothetical protein
MTAFTMPSTTLPADRLTVTQSPTPNGRQSRRAVIVITDARSPLHQHRVRNSCLTEAQFQPSAEMHTH